MSIPSFDTPAREQQTYVIDTESSAELARLIHQDRLTTQAMGGLLPEQADLSGVHSLLDIACGPGEWALEVANTYRHIEVVGIDISHSMIEYARSLAHVQKLTNIKFHVMNALKPLNFPLDSFDLVNARFIFAFMSPATWPILLKECTRVTRPGGIIRLTEGEPAISNGPASEQVISLFTDALKHAGFSLSPASRVFGITPMLERFLHDTGCINIQRQPHMLNFSAGMPAHQGWYQNCLVALKLLQPFLSREGRFSQQELDLLYEQALQEFQDEGFCGIRFFLTAWGQKPPGSAKA